MRSKSRDAALADEIVRLSRKGLIRTPFRVSDFRPHVHGFSENHITTVLANYERNGDQVRRGHKHASLESTTAYTNLFETNLNVEYAPK